MVTAVMFHLNMLKHGEVQWTLIWWAEIELGSILGKQLWNRWTQCRISAGDVPRGMALPVSSVSEWSRLQDFQLLHFPAESLWPQLTGTAINSVKTTLWYLLSLKVMFIDWNFPELIWPNVKFSIHTQTPLNEGKYGQPTNVCWKEIC